MKYSKDTLTGIAVTVSVHLAVIVFLLVAVVRTGVFDKEQSYLLDFSKKESPLPSNEDKRSAAEQRIEQLLRDAGVQSARETPRNVRVDRGALKDDRGTDAEKLYNDAERIEREYRENMAREDGEINIVQKPPIKKEEQKETPVYQGPSVLSYSLSGRKGSYLPIPAYKCVGEGEVTVIITVDPSGKVTNAKIQEEVSSTDTCLRNYALKAARSSRFSANPGAPSRQIGNIVYSFVAQ